MTDAVNYTTPYSYYNVLNPTAPGPVPSADYSTLNSTNSSSSTTSANNNNVTPASPTSSTGVQLSSNVLALLQQFLNGESSSSSDPLSGLLGGGTNSSTDPISALIGGSANSSSNPLSTLLGDDNSSENALNALLNKAVGNLQSNVYASLVTAAYAGANEKASATSLAQSSSILQSVLSDYQAYQNISSSNS